MEENRTKVRRLLRQIQQHIISTDETVQRKRDPFYAQAIIEIKELYKKDPKQVFYVRQLQCLFEKRFYHWVTDRAILRLEQESFLVRIPRVGRTGVTIHFYVHRSHRYPARRINEMMRIIEQYS